MAATALAVSTSSGSSRGGPNPNVRPHQARLARSLLLGGRPSPPRRRLRTALAASSGKQKPKPPPGEAEEKVPAWAKPGAEEPPPWAREGGAARGPEEAGQVPFYAYLLASAITAIAAIGSIFEYTNQRPVFGIVGSDSALYAPILGFFVFTGIPTSAFLWFKAVQTANREAEEQDRRDGFL
ncbi:uncharacterized protein LOC8077035 [Sorghum bicolor]|uniref:Uncharacterized protein n=1 Tax=Sorghum bicolor TaxID=4558 RepID=C5Z081_SORBI|nr:uncharacterized protein LOC8077035 [Sorghum bicolor]EES19726.1 hypothetical protein SORBI_3009G179800 [Sorghum bicolor]|eukprot:XP_002441296.1 uncharacterized protein LOC8077035 [Sorghum bicolor]